MPRIRQNEELYARKDFQTAIKHAKTDAEIRNLKSLAADVGIPYSSFWKLMQEPEKITLGQLRKLLSVIPLPASALLAFVGYERKEPIE